MGLMIQFLISLAVAAFSLSTFAQSANVQAPRGQEYSEVKITQIAKTTTQWDGSPLPPYPSQNPEITILSYEIPVGVKLPMHKHPVINAGVVMQGTLTVNTKDGKQLILNPGDSIVELVNQWHYGMNQGPETVKLMMFYVGEVGVPLAIKE